MNSKANACCLAAVMTTVFSGSAVFATNERGMEDASAEIVIKATPKVVWQAVHEARQSDDDLEYSKVISRIGNTETLEQKFIGLPVLGSAIAVLQQTEIPYNRIDYSMVSSDKFKKLQGSWTFKPSNGGKETILRLSSSLDVGIPFSGGMVRNATKRKVVHRVENVKRLAEQAQARLAASGKEDL